MQTEKDTESQRTPGRITGIIQYGKKICIQRL